MRNLETAKEYLNRIHTCEVKIKQVEEEIETLQELVTSTSINSESEKVLSSASQDKMADLIVHIQMQRDRLADEVRKYTDIRADIINKINQLNNSDYKQILYQRYCLHKTWEKIAVDLGYTRQWICKLHGRALIEFEKIINSC